MAGAHGSTVNSKMLWSIEGKRDHQLKCKQKPNLNGWAQIADKGGKVPSVAEALLVLLALRHGYSDSPIAVHRKHTLKWLFPQEKATLHAA